MHATLSERDDRSLTPADGVPARADLELLSGFSLCCDGRPVRLPHGAQRVLAFLALRERPQQRAHVASILWLDSAVEKAGGSLRSALWRIRRAGQQELVVADGEWLSLAEHVAVDLHRIRPLAEGLCAAGACLGPGSAPAELAHDILPAWDEDWVAVEREHFKQVRLHALEALSVLSVRRGRFGEAVDAALEALAGDPLRESAHRALIAAYLAEGNRGEALRQFRACHRLFHEKLGLRPSIELEELITEALTQR